MPSTPPHLIAGGTIRPHRFVVLDTTGTHEAIEGTANAEVIDVAAPATNMPPLSDLVSTSNAATEDQSFRVFGDGDIALLEAGAAITPGVKIKSDSVGRGTPIATSGTTLQYYGARALQEATAAGELILVMVDIGSVRPAIA